MSRYLRHVAIPKADMSLFIFEGGRYYRNTPVAIAENSTFFYFFLIFLILITTLWLFEIFSENTSKPPFFE